MKYVKKIGIPTLTFILGLAIAGGIGIVVAENIASSAVDYNKNSQATVEDALDDLYEKANNSSKFPALGDNFANTIINLYNGDGYNYLYYHDKQGTYGTYEAGDLSYRYAGPSSSVLNYVCFGSDAATCPEDNLYRIIGVFKNDNDEYQVKLIKATKVSRSIIGSNGASKSGYEYYFNWNTATNNNTWSQSNLNTINLNTNFINYLNGINSKWISYIDDYSWVVGGVDSNFLSKNGYQNSYNYEFKTPANNDKYIAKIGLMYITDFMYASNPKYWSQNPNYYINKESEYINWNYALEPSNGLTSEYTITRYSATTAHAMSIGRSVSDDNRTYYIRIGTGQVNYGNQIMVRPSFYLKTGIKYSSGFGTVDSPYRISI